MRLTAFRICMALITAVFTTTAGAENIEATLDSSNGSSSFVVRNAASNSLFSVNSAGTVTGMSSGGADPGIPHIQYEGARSIKVFGQNVTLNGFRYAGFYTKSTATTKPFTNAIVIYSYDIFKRGVGMPSLAGGGEMWVAVFAVSTPTSSTASIAFVPFLRATSYNAGVVTINTNVGALTAGYFTGADVLICKSAGQWSGRVTTASGNGTGTITLADTSISISAGDYVLPAPGPGVEYKYLRSLKLEAEPSEWRNFYFAGNRVYSYTGNPFGNISSTSGQAIDFSNYVSPLSVGVIGSVQTYITDASGSAAYTYITADAVHVTAQIGVDRTSTSGDGTSGMFDAAFFRDQQLWIKVSAANVIGRITILGWIED
jgi:hypothetical protein